MLQSQGSFETGIDDSCLLPVVERFVSVNGEGPRAGRLAAFIRFAGCNLACSWCDTAWANVENCDHEDMEPRDLVEWVSDTGASCVTLTGGEPALQRGLPALVSALLDSDKWGSGDGRVVEIETNGAVDLSVLHDLRSEFRKKCALSYCSSIDGADYGVVPSALDGDVYFTVDCKMPSSGMTTEMLPGNYDLLGSGDAVKFVVASIEDLECAQSIIEQYDLCARCEVFFSPVFSCIEPSEIVSFMERQGLSEVRLQLQLHKIIWPGQDRGV